MQVVDRKGFIGWTEGIYLSFENGVGWVANEADCIAAQEALEMGEKIALTRNGKIVSYLVPTQDGYQEIGE